ncbi:hypothetical protein D3C87_1134180 [compost metagenome]
MTNGSGVPSWGTISSDAFTQYALLAGRAGGQVLNGGTAASNNLTLASTSHATKGFVLLNPAGGNVGIGTSTPATKLDISGGDVTFDITKGLTSRVGAQLKTGVAGATWQTWPADAGSASFIANLFNNSTAFIVSSAGNVGIGNVDPQNLLDLASSTNRRISFSPATLVSEESKIEFRHNDNGNPNVPYAAVSGYLLNGGTGYNSGQLRFYTAPVGAGNPAMVERMRIDPAGNVGIGTTAPKGPLHIKAPSGSFATGSMVFEGTTGTSAFGMINSSDKLWIGSNVNWGGGYPQADYLPRLVIDSVGLVGIGTGAPNYPLQVSSGNTYTVISNTNITAGGLDWRWYSSSSTAPLGANAMCFGTGACILSIYSNGGATLAGTLTQGSDVRWKRDISSIDSALDSVMKLEGVTYYWKDQNKEQNKQIGLIAQSVEKVFPEAVKTDAKGYKSVAYQNLVAPLINAIHELKALIDGTQVDVAVLKEEMKLQSQEIDKLKIENEKKDRELKEIKQLLCIQNPKATFCH